MKNKVILICLFIAISLVILSTGKASWQDPLQVSGSVITGSWKEPEQIGLAGKLEPGVLVEGLLDGTGLPGEEAEDPETGDGLDTSTPPEENGDGVGGAGVGTIDSGMGQEPGDVEGEAEPTDISGGSETGSSSTAADQGFVTDDKGMTSPNAPDSTGVSDTPGVSDIPDVSGVPDVSDNNDTFDAEAKDGARAEAEDGAEVDDDADDNNGAEADTATDDTVAGGGADDAATDDTDNTDNTGKVAD